MPHYKRINSESGYYHVISRGINKMNIFDEDNDYKNFINLIRIYSKKYEISVVAYCLMKNHFHILIKDTQRNRSMFVRCIKQIYSSDYNQRNNRIGPLFNDRFKDKPIDKIEYLKIVFRYILLNPEKAGIAKYDKYLWSSYQEYFKQDTFLDMNCVLKICGDTHNIHNLLEEKDWTNCVYSDDPIINYRIESELYKTFGIYDISITYFLSNEKKFEIIKLLLNNGLTINKISNLTRIKKWQISYILNRTCP